MYNNRNNKKDSPDSIKYYFLLYKLVFIVYNVSKQILYLFCNNYKLTQGDFYEIQEYNI